MIFAVQKLKTDTNITDFKREIHVDGTYAY